MKRVWKRIGRSEWAEGGLRVPLRCERCGVHIDVVEGVFGGSDFAGDGARSQGAGGDWECGSGSCESGCQPYAQLSGNCS